MITAAVNIRCSVSQHRDFVTDWTLLRRLLHDRTLRRMFILKTLSSFVCMGLRTRVQDICDAALTTDTVADPIIA